MRLLGKLLEKRNKTPRTSLTDKDIFYVFNRIIKNEFGNIGAGKLVANFFKNKILFIKAENASWGSELFTNRTSIIRKMNQELGEDAIREIKLK